MIEDTFIGMLRQSTGWLYTQIYSNQFFFLDYWSFVHFWSGFVVFIALVALRYKGPWLWLVFWLFTYELVEIFLLYLDCRIFLPETLKDQLNDILLGLSGGFVSYNILKNSGKIMPGKYQMLPDLSALFTTTTIAFVWVGNYCYFFPGKSGQQTFDLSLFLIWSVLGYLFLEAYIWYLKHRRVSMRGSLRIILPAFVILMIILVVREDAFASKSFIPGVNGTRQSIRLTIITSFFCCFPFLEVCLYHAFNHMINKAKAECLIK